MSGSDEEFIDDQDASEVILEEASQSLENGEIINLAKTLINPVNNNTIVYMSRSPG